MSTGFREETSIVKELLLFGGSAPPESRVDLGRSQLSFHQRHASVEPKRPKLYDQLAERFDALPAHEIAFETHSYQQFLQGVQATEVTAYLWVKRMLDVVGALVGLIVLSPVYLIVAALVKLTDGGPVFYCHDRVGYKGRVFRCYKFRSMRPDADRIRDKLLKQNKHSDDRTFKMENDPRITTVGRWIRKASIDELPQLYNVLLGDMSLVGPRPPIPAEVARYSLRDLRRFEVKPGITCIWQVSGRSRLPFSTQLELDFEYMRKRSLWFDLKLLAMTIPAVLSGDGAC